MTRGGVQSYVDARWVELHYTDLAGRLRSITIARREGGPLVARADGSNLGLSKVENSDVLLVADERTLVRVPWAEDTFRAICDIYEDRSKRHPLDPRYVPQRLESMLLDLGLRSLLGVELEFFVFKSFSARSSPFSGSFEVEVADVSGGGLHSRYHASPDPLERFRGELVRTLGSFPGIEPQGHHREVASSQVEVSLRAGGPVGMSDAIQTTKYVAKHVARSLGLVAVFMPKPLHNEAGSGMHVHVSLWRHSTNVFYDPDDPHGLSKEARYFIGGLLHHARALAALVAPTVNSYRRLFSGLEAPAYAIWGFRNRCAAVRVPTILERSDARVEFRPPDPAANPYLALSAIVLAGLDGIKNSLDPGDPADGCPSNVSWMPKYARMPASLLEALGELDADRSFLKPVFSDELIDRYLEVKAREHVEVSRVPSAAELLLYSSL